MIGLANIDIPCGKQAVQAWRRLDWRTRQAVIRLAWRGLGHPDPGIAAIAVGRAQATLRASLRRWVLVVLASLLVNWPLLWVIGRLIGGLDDDQRLWFWLPISLTPGALAALWVQARQIERVNLATLYRQ
ncbi:MAG TPA: hypothetical protein VGC06_04890 [Actinomycetes bacterium]